MNTCVSGHLKLQVSEKCLMFYDSVCQTKDEYTPLYVGDKGQEYNLCD